MKLKIRTTPNLANDSSAHQEAIQNKDHFRAWEFNVANHLKDKTVEEIGQYLKDTANPFAVCMENWVGDFNFSSLIRNANGFNAEKVYYIGDKKYDKRGAVGTYNYTDVQFLPTINDLLDLKNDYCFVGCDNVSGSIPLPSYNWPKKPLMILGSEGTGLTKEVQSMCKDIVHIPMMGSVRSFNAAAASAIIMYDFVRKLSE
jgi:tRNA G18 (ribose-2'-O)-methylase SpoU